MLEAKPVSLTPKRRAALGTQPRRRAGRARARGRARLISAGPFPRIPGVREYPPGSSLFELEQTRRQRARGRRRRLGDRGRARALARRQDRARARRRARSRTRAAGPIFNRARGRLKRTSAIASRPSRPRTRANGSLPPTRTRCANFSGMPKEAHTLEARRLDRMLRGDSLLGLPGRLPRRRDPESARSRARMARFSTRPSAPRAASACRRARAPRSSMTSEREEHSMSDIVLPWRGKRAWKIGEFATLLNRRGENLGTGRVLGDPGAWSLVRVEVRTHLAWDARGLRPIRASTATDEAFVCVHAHAEPSGRRARRDHFQRREAAGARQGSGFARALRDRAQPRDRPSAMPRRKLRTLRVDVDGVEKLACRTEVHRGMTIKLDDFRPRRRPGRGSALPVHESRARRSSSA